VYAPLLNQFSPCPWALATIFETDSGFLSKKQDTLKNAFGHIGYILSDKNIRRVRFGFSPNRAF
jgi:hypothetical protein